MKHRQNRRADLHGKWIASLTLLLAVIAGMALTGCDLTDMGYGFGYGGLGYYDYGFYPDAGTIQSVNDYRQDAFDTANQAWDDYIRERRK